MRVNVRFNFNPQQIMDSRGLGNNKKVQKYLASEVNRLSASYVPFQQGNLQKATISGDGSNLVYTAPHAHYQFYGKAMGGRPPKRYTGAALTYNGAPMRGARWTARMVADKGKEIESNVKTFISKKGG